MEVTVDIYTWLLSIGVLKEADVTFKSEEIVILEEEVTEEVKSGLKVSEIIKQLYILKVQSYSQKNLPFEIQALNEINNRTDTIFNWNIITNALIICGIETNTKDINDLLFNLKEAFSSLQEIEKSSLGYNDYRRSKC